MPHRDANGLPTIRSSIPMSLFGFGLAMGLVVRPVGVIGYLGTAIRGVDETGEAWPADWRLMIGMIGGLHALLLIVFIAVAYFYFKRRSIARWLIIIASVAAMVVEAGEATWRLALGNGDAEYTAELVAPLVPFCLVGTAWTLYFLLSKRVRETLVYPLRDESLAGEQVAPSA